MAKVRNRYIAGAVCPACGAVDKIYVIDAGGEKSRHCRACDSGESPGDGLLEDRQPVDFRDSGYGVDGSVTAPGWAPRPHSPLWLRNGRALL